MREGIKAFLCHTKLLTTNIAPGHKFILNDPFYSFFFFRVCVCVCVCMCFKNIERFTNLRVILAQGPC